jgi:hypothetical protein
MWKKTAQREEVKLGFYLILFLTHSHCVHSEVKFKDVFQNSTFKNGEKASWRKIKHNEL